jgi:hypothetical protein
MSVGSRQITELATRIAIMRAMTLQFDCVWLRLSAIERFGVLQLRDPGLVRLIKGTREEAADQPE